MTPLYAASMVGNTEVVNILISNGADVNMARHVSYMYIDMHDYRIDRSHVQILWPAFEPH